MSDRHKRSFAKGATWRIIGTADTILLSFLFTEAIEKALKIGWIELFTKIFLFYLHERIWDRLSFGKSENPVEGILRKTELHSRSVFKGISWRVVGSIDTFWIVLFVSRGSLHATQTAFYITATEVFTKIFFFWLHERMWMKIKWGS